MKTSTVGIVSAAILMVVAGVGFGIAQAGGDQSDNPTFTLQDKELGEQYKDYLGGSSARVLPSAIDLNNDAGGSPTQGMAQAREAVETGSLPAGSNADVNQPYDPTLSFVDQDVPPSLDMGQAVEFCPEDCFAGTDWQTRGAVETGAIPARVPEEPWLKEYGND